MSSPARAFVDGNNEAGQARAADSGSPARAFVDGNNVMGSRPDGWWRDRAAAQRRLIADIEAAARGSGREWTVVFDGAPPSRARGEESVSPGGVRWEAAASPGGVRGEESASSGGVRGEESSPPDGVRVEYARRKGANAADDRIVELLAALPEGADAVVYTSDRGLRERAVALGARVEGAGALLRMAGR